MKRATPLLITLFCGLVLFAIGMLWQKPEVVSGAKEWVRICSNALLLPGTLLTGIGGLVRISEEHFFDGLTYAMGNLFSHLLGLPKRHDTYYGYIHRERQKSGAAPLLAAGCVYLAAAVALTLLFYVL